uniref:Gag-pol polyprotein n=1 Tax=Solanum tuberosum TaxID=4113 RepID=M1DPF5_SOLTU
MDTMATRIMDLTRMNAPEFNGSKVDEDPQEFVDEVKSYFHLRTCELSNECWIGMDALTWYLSVGGGMGHYPYIPQGITGGLLKVEAQDKGSKLSFATHYVVIRFDVSPEILSNPFKVSTPIGDSIVAKRVYKNCLVFVSHRVTHVDLGELDMLDFDVILGMDWIPAFFASIYCRTRLVTFKVLN